MIAYALVSKDTIFRLLVVSTVKFVPGKFLYQLMSGKKDFGRRSAETFHRRNFWDIRPRYTGSSSKVFHAVVNGSLLFGTC